LRGLSKIGDRLYAVGMRRQVHRRERVGGWVRFDDGALQEPSTSEPRGFNAISGLSEKDMVAVGLAGEIYRCDGSSWHPVDSPTDVTLNAVVTRPDGAHFACGQRGTLLRTRNKRWRQMTQDLTDEPLWDLTWFGGQLYIAADDGLLRLNSRGKLQRVTRAADSHPRALRARDGILMCISTRSITWTTDGEHWAELV
jgi:hypothetical protein